MLMATMLGEFTQGNACDGADFLCDTRGGIFSCRPCDSAQLAVFQGLQAQANRLVTALGISTSLLLETDGRVGPQTTRTVAFLVTDHLPKFGPPPPALAAPAFTATPEYIARFAEEILVALQRATELAVATGPATPAPPAIPDTGSGGGTTPVTEPTAPPGGKIVTVGPDGKRKRTPGQAAFLWGVGILAVAAVGFAGYSMIQAQRDLGRMKRRAA